MDFIYWLAHILEIEKPSDILLYTGFLLVLLTALGWWVTILMQMFDTNPALGVFMSVVSVGFLFIFSGLFLHEKGS